MSGMQDLIEALRKRGDGLSLSAADVLTELHKGGCTFAIVDGQRYDICHDEDHLTLMQKENGDDQA